MGLPAKRRPKSSKLRRAAHFALRKISLTECSHCHKPVLPHRVCRNCGYYRGRPVLRISTKLDRKAKKKLDKRREAGKEPEPKEKGKKEEGKKK